MELDTSLKPVVDMKIVGFEVKEKLARLQNALLTAHPTMPTLLREIHSNLKMDPAVVTLFSEEDIAIVVNGLKRQTATEIAVAAIGKKGPKSGKKASLDDNYADEL